MAHKSRKKHIKHVRQHQAEEQSHSKEDAPVAKASGVGVAKNVRLASRANAAKAAVKDRAGKVVERARAAKEEGKARAAKLAGRAGAGEKREPKEKGGLVRRIAKAATKKIAAKPQRALSRAKARVRSLLGREKAVA